MAAGQKTAASSKSCCDELQTASLPPGGSAHQTSPHFVSRHRSQGNEKQALHERLSSLSTREREVLEGLVAGKPNKLIAFDLGISPRTVEIYRANVMTKMQAGSLSELVRMALVSGILPASGQ